MDFFFAPTLRKQYFSISKSSIITITIDAVVIISVMSFFCGMPGTVILGIVVVLTTMVVDTIFWNIPTIGSFGTLNITVHAVAFTVNGVIVCHIPLVNLKGCMSDEDMLQGYCPITFTVTFAEVDTLMLNALISV